FFFFLLFCLFCFCCLVWCCCVCCGGCIGWGFVLVFVVVGLVCCCWFVGFFVFVVGVVDCGGMVVFVGLEGG
ncbi:hypothetical protein, partial [Pseudomonas syringae group genomosp. 7]|uniref:hypothetical protein n=1 Tax=Pseudomonas syringae group genomosp. 7 TaxID=251699 RepID=UPI00377013B1